MLQEIRRENQLAMGVSNNRGTPKSSIFIGFSVTNHPFWGTPIFWKHPYGKISHDLPGMFHKVSYMSRVVDPADF